MTNNSTRIFLFHAVKTSMEPTERAFKDRWKECRTFNLMDDSLSADLAQAGVVTPEISARFLKLAEYARDCDASGILYTCSAFGSAVDNVRRHIDLPILKPNEAMIDEALRAGTRFHVLATFEPALNSIVPEIELAAEQQSTKISLTTQFVPSALDRLVAGDTAQHDALVVDAAAAVRNADVILLAQFAMAHTRPQIEQCTSVPVLTTPESAVDRLRALVSPCSVGPERSRATTLGNF